MNIIIVLALIAVGYFFLIKDFNKEKSDIKHDFKNSSLGDEARLIVSMIAKFTDEDESIVYNTIFQLSSHFEKEEETEKALRDLFNQEQKNTTSVIEYAKAYAVLVDYDSFRCEEIIEFLLNLTFFDGCFTNEKQENIEQIVKIFKIRPSDYERMLYKFMQSYSKKKDEEQSNKDPYEILGLKKNASFDEVKIKYRQLVKQFHPDILLGKGESEINIEKATQRLQDINSAYKTIKSLTR